MSSKIDHYRRNLGIEIAEELYESPRHILVLAGADKKVLDDLGWVIKKEFIRRQEFFSIGVVLDGNGSSNDKISNLLDFVKENPKKVEWPRTKRYFMVKDPEGEFEKSARYKSVEDNVFLVELDHPAMKEYVKK